MSVGIVQLLISQATCPAVYVDVTPLLTYGSISGGSSLGFGVSSTGFALQFTKSTNQRWSCEFTLKDESGTGANRPVVGQTFELKEDGVLIFTGFIDQIDEGEYPSGTNLAYYCRCSSWASILDHTVVTKTYVTNALAAIVIADIISTKLAANGITGNNVSVTGVLDSPLALEPVLATQAMDTIRDIVDGEWWVDESKDLHFITQGTGPDVGFALNQTASPDIQPWLAGSMRVTTTTKDFRNAQYVSSTALGAPPATTQNVSSPTTGSLTTITDTYVIPANLSGCPAVASPVFFVQTSQAIQGAPVTVTKNGISQTVVQGWDSKGNVVTPYGQAAWYWGVGMIGVQWGQQQTGAPTVGDVIVISYQGYAGQGGTTTTTTGTSTTGSVSQKNWVEAENAASIAARALIEGTTGRWEQVSSVPRLDDPTVALTLANGLLSRSDFIPSIIQFDTFDNRYRNNIGGTISVNIPMHGINGTFSIISVQARCLQSQSQASGQSYAFIYTVQLSNAVNIGDYVKWFEGLIRSIGSSPSGGGGGTGQILTGNQIQPIWERPPSGTQDGANKNFTLLYQPLFGKIDLFVNGVQQNVSTHGCPSLGPDYSLFENTITFTVAPKSDDFIEAFYFVGIAAPAQQNGLQVYSTGVDIGGNLAPLGSLEQHWQISASTDPAFPGPFAYVWNSATVTAAVAAGNVPNLSDAQWIGPSPTSPDNNKTITYKLSFTISAPFDPATAKITGKVAADDELTMKLNGATVLTIGVPAFNAMHAFSLATGFVQGTNTIECVITGDGTSPTGLILEIISATVSQ